MDSKELETRISELERELSLLKSMYSSENIVVDNSCQFLFQNSMDGFAYCKMIFEHEIPVDFTILSVNAAFEKIMGLHHITGGKVSEIMPEIITTHPEIITQFGTVAVTEKPRKFEVFLNPLHIWLSISAFCPKNGYVLAIFEDSTQRKNIESANQKNLDFLNKILDKSPNPLCVFDGNATLIRMNHACHNTFKQFDQDAIGNYSLLSDTFIESQGFTPLVKQVFEKGNEAHFELAYFTDELQDNEIDSNQYFDIHMSPIVDSNGTVSNVIVEYTDISYQKRTEKILRASEFKLSMMLENSKDAIGVHINGVWHMCNQSTLQLFGYSSQEELMGKSILNVISPSERDRIGNFVRNRMQNERAPIEYITRGLRKDGSEFEMEVTLSSLILENKRHVIVILRDITERLLAEETIRKSEARYRFLFENMTTGYMLHEVITDENNFPIDFKFIETNQYYKNLTGGDPLESIGKTIKEMFPNADNEMIQKYCQVGITGEPLIQEYYSKTYNKYIKVCCYSPEKGIFAAIYEDITERKLAELKIQQQNQELIRLNEDKDQFMSILAHDLKSPFGSLLGFSELLLQNLNTYSLAEIEDRLSFILNSGVSIYNLLDDILSWSRLQSGKITFTPLNVSIIEICKEIQGNLNLFAMEKNIQINFPTAEDIIMYADRHMIKTILRNLISNAIKFTNEGGNIHITVEKGLTEFIIAVTDTGIGIKPETLSKLFDNSQLITEQGTSHEQGTGLGLNLCKEFVEKHNGKIWAESELERGSTFKFTLPYPIMQGI